MNSETVYATLCLCAVVTGCAPGPLVDDYRPQASPPGLDREILRAPAEPGGEITLAEALAVALLHNPRLTSFAWEIRAREAAVIQAGLIPNPLLAVEIEDFGGTGGFGGFGQSQTTIAVGQTILLGGKRGSRIELAQLHRDLVGWDYEAARVEVITHVGIEFVNTLAAQERVVVARETAALAGQVFSAIDQRVQAGKVSPVERTKARVDRAQAQLVLTVAERELVAARYRLCRNVGERHACL